MNIIALFEQYCATKGIEYNLEDKVSPYNDSTLFCPAGMQKHIQKFKDTSYKGTEANIQPCIRMNDFHEIGDMTHLLYFNMVGLFSFREYTVGDAIDFWMEFLVKYLNLRIDYVTIHPDRKEWASLYGKWLDKQQIRYTNECVWGDGDIGGYCTEFFINDIEIGNIVNPLGDCIDCGFGLERIDLIVNNRTINKKVTLINTAKMIISSGYYPSNTKQGYVLRKILREIYKNGWSFDHEYFNSEVKNSRKIIDLKIDFHICQKNGGMKQLLKQ